MKKHFKWIPISGIFLFYLVLSITGVHTTCYFKAFTGIPCPGCGMTRAYMSLLEGDVKGAFYYHPLFLLPPILAIMLLLSYKKKITIKKWIWGVIFLLLIGVYIFRMLMQFPDTEPMTFYGSAYIPRFIHAMKEFLK